jgi:hypothetical protein
METNPIWCPFCGSDEVTADDPDIDGIFCQGCGFWWSFDGDGDYDVIRAETIARWNSRPIEDALRAEVERLREAWQDALRTLGEAWEIESDRRQSIRMLRNALEQISLETKDDHAWTVANYALARVPLGA